MTLFTNRRLRIQLIIFLCVAVAAPCFPVEFHHVKQVSLHEACIPAYKNIDHSYIYYSSAAVLPEPFLIKREAEYESGKPVQDILLYPANYHRSTDFLIAVIATSAFHYLIALLLG